MQVVTNQDEIGSILESKSNQFRRSRIKHLLIANCMRYVQTGEGLNELQHLVLLCRNKFGRPFTDEAFAYVVDESNASTTCDRVGMLWTI